MERIECGEVYAYKKNVYYVKLTKSAKCEGCKACGFGRKNHVILPARSQVDCNVGDTVFVAMPERDIKGSYVYLYLIPLLLMFVGLLIPYAHGELWMLCGGGIGLAAGIVAIYLFERLFRKREKYLPTILHAVPVGQSATENTQNTSEKTIKE